MINLVQIIITILCSANILLNKSLQAKIGDFGFSRKLPQMPQGYTLVIAAMTVKSLGYSAPELDGRKQSPKSDVYSYGVVSLNHLNVIFALLLTIKFIVNSRNLHWPTGVHKQSH